MVCPGAGWTHATLLDFLRGRGLTGAKEGCAEGECGTCTVLVVGGEHRASYRAVNSCLLPVTAVAGHDIYTVESLASGGELAAAQQAMAAAGGSQCGYCTPGFVMSLVAEQYRPGRQGPCDPLALAGNLCRCTGYRPIRDAALSLGTAPPGPLRDRLAQPAPRLDAHTADGFTRPSTVEACVAVLGSQPDATVIAGGTDVGVDLNLHGRRWTHLVSVEAIDELRAFTADDHRILIGAALPLADLAAAWTRAPAAVADWFTLFASPPIRNRATLGGNLATASPIGDSAPLLLALDAVVHLAGPAGRRSVPLESFFTGYRKTARGPGEILTAVELPLPLPQHLRFYKASKRRLDDISTVAAAFALDLDAAGRVRRARVAFGGMAATPLRVRDAEDVLIGTPWNAAAVERVQRVLDRTLQPRSDVRGSKAYRAAVASSLVEKFFAEAR
jgi:xanthine dehydrogenase small subunit